MCEALVELRDGMSRYAAVFDPALVSASDAARVVGHAAAIEKMAATVKGLAAAQVAETEVWRGDGDRTAAHHLARTTGTSIGAAAEAIDTARRLGRLPETAAAARRGELSQSQVSAIADAASADLSAETRLVEHARRSSLQELKDDCARTKAAASTDSEARRKRIHDRRCLRTYTDASGTWHMHVNNNPEVGAEIMAVLDPLRDRLFADARAQGLREPSEAYAADALVVLARDAALPSPGASLGEPRAPRRARAKIIVRVDLAALLRGYPLSGELAELVGFGPVAVSVIRDMMESQDAFLAAVATKGVDIVGVAHLGRRPTAHQQTALEFLYPPCAVEGCSAVARLEMDHRDDWASTHFTLFSLIDRLCPHHHSLKTRENWRLVEGHGKRGFVPPTDARHPRHASSAQRPPAAAATGPPGAA